MVTRRIGAVKKKMPARCGNIHPIVAEFRSIAFSVFFEAMKHRDLGKNYAATGFIV
jgi:hypothetical protein